MPKESAVETQTEDSLKDVYEKSVAQSQATVEQDATADATQDGKPDDVETESAEDTDAQEQAPDTDAPGKPDAEAGVKTELPPVSEDDRDYAFRVLLNDGWPVTKIQKMIDDDPHGVVAFAKGRTAVAQEQTQETPKQNDDTGRGEKPFTYDQLIAPIKELDNDVPGISEKIGSSFQQLVTAMIAQARATDDRINRLHTALEDGKVDSYQRQMIEDGFSDLKDPGVVAQVAGKFNRIRSGYDDPREAYRDAVYAVVGPGMREQGARQQDARKRSEGQPTVRPGGKKQPEGADPLREVFEKSWKKHEGVGAA